MAQLFLFLGCGGSNGPATTTGTAGTTGSGSAGTTGSGSAGTTGSGAAGTTGSGSAGTTGSGSAGTTGSGTAGTTGAGGSGTTGFGMPACGNTVSTGVAIAKNGTCTADDTQLCYKTCGPEKAGVKSETCSGGVYVEMSGCSFDPAVSHACYTVPATQDPSCPTTAIMPGACTIADCIVCGATAGYVDSSGAPKTGYCVCQASGTWSCASNTAWPCAPGVACP